MIKKSTNGNQSKKSHSGYVDFSVNARIFTSLLLLESPKMDPPNKWQSTSPPSDSPQGVPVTMLK
jgi:hypothetical protein